MVITINTDKKDEFINITSLIRQQVEKSGVRNGVVTVFVPHTTAGITINENADPDVVIDILTTLNMVFPDRKEYRHFEGNSAAHMKASVMGSSCNVIIENGTLKLGTWQGIYFCEFDGPRTRKVYLKIIEG
ncbi:MAG: YjbQ family protein [Clostridiaceae bacterium]|nr:YjbQ family protein [Clostridiaceae bacterium]